MRCQQCDSVYINGVFCHETGCSLSGKPQPRRSTPQKPKPQPRFYEVIVSNLGKVWEGTNPVIADGIFGNYRQLSINGYGRAAGEDVSLWCDNEPIREHHGTTTESN